MTTQMVDEGVFGLVETTAGPAVRLLEPNVALEEAFADFLAEFFAYGEQFINGGGPMTGLRGGTFSRRVQAAQDASAGIDVPDGHVPNTTYWLVIDGTIVGTANLRHHLNAALFDCGGHIGYSIRPTQRNKGYATMLLGMVLNQARALGLDQVLLTCKSDNIASARVIENNGGKLESHAYSPRVGRYVRRYWIGL